MKDTELYRRLLGIEKPWSIDRVELNMAEERVDIWLTHERSLKWPCPDCGAELLVRDHVEERTWRHLDTCQVRTFIRARIPRVDCEEHGVRQVLVPWAEPLSRFTLMMERFAIDVLLQASTVLAATRLLRITWDEAWGIKERAVARGQARKEDVLPEYIGVDEKAFRKGHSYMTIVSDIEEGTVEHVARDRKVESLKSYFDRFSKQELAGIKGVAMDMWGPYIQATLACVPDAGSKIVYDRFHIMSHVGKAVDQVRREEHADLLSGGDETLKHTRYLWLYSDENLPDRHRPTLGALQELNLKVGRAWAIKETLRDLWTYRSPGWARHFFRDWYAWACRSRLEPIKRVARMLRDRLDNIVTYCKHRITQGVAEGLNSKIMAIKRYACGFRNAHNFETAIYFHCGGLDLYPSYPT
jgi:transposase